MEPSYKGNRFPPEIICYSVWLYHRFTLSQKILDVPETESKSMIPPLGVADYLRWKAVAISHYKVLEKLGDGGWPLADRWILWALADEGHRPEQV